MDANHDASSVSLDDISAEFRADFSNHPFLVRFRTGVVTLPEMRRFAVQWYLTAKLHKDSFPAIILNTTDQDIRFDLIEILREEYGSGDRSKMHARMLERFALSIGILPSEMAESNATPGVLNFGRDVLRVWRDDPPARGFGLHFALESIAAFIHACFADGVRQSHLTSETEYFDVHRTAEEGHADISKQGFTTYFNNDDARQDLLDGVTTARRILRALLDDFDRYVFRTSAQAA